MILRAMSLLFVFGALCVVYVVLRRRFSRDAAIAGVLAIGSHDLVVAHAFEARFYGLWLLCCAVFAWSLSASRHRMLKVAVSAVLVTTSHWYGIVSLGLMSSAVVLSYGRDWRAGLRAVAPSAVGVLALLAISPLASGQRAAITVNSWIPDFTIGQILGLSSVFWTTTVPMLAAAAIVLGLILGWRRDRAEDTARVARDTVADPGTVALLSLALMPLVLALISALGLPSLIGRYAIPTALAWGPFVAFAVELLGSRAGRWPALVFALGLAGLWFVRFTREAQRKRAFAVGVQHETRVLQRAEGMGLPVVFQSLHTLYPQTAEGMVTGGRVAFLELPDSTLNAIFPDSSRFYQLNKGIWLERDFARVHAARFGIPTLASQAALDSTPRFLLIATPVRLPRGVYDVTALAAAVFPHHRVVPVADDLLLLERPSVRSLPARNTSR